MTSHSQRNWDDPVCEATFANIFSSADVVARAPLLASTSNGSGQWLHALPSSALGLTRRPVLRSVWGSGLTWSFPTSVSAGLKSWVAATTDYHAKRARDGDEGTVICAFTDNHKTLTMISLKLSSWYWMKDLTTTEDPVIERNGYFGYFENILLAMLTDSRQFTA